MSAPVLVPRKIRDREDAVACLAAVAASCKPLRAWCHAEGISARSLNIWRLILDRAGAPRVPRLRLVELLASPTRTPEPLRVRVGDFAIDVPTTFDDETLRRVVAVLRQC